MTTFASELQVTRTCHRLKKSRTTVGYSETVAMANDEERWCFVFCLIEPNKGEGEEGWRKPFFI